MPSFKMTYPYAIDSAVVGHAEPGEVREFDENPDPNFWAEATAADLPVAPPPVAPEPAAESHDQTEAPASPDADKEN